ncbi:MAG: hypothetical protein FWD67_11410, partial [Betaproteobacteria bacterium]|nr:hypothetical protein [Betaproteobacteria bacterium]
GSFGEGKGVAACVGSGSFGEGKGVAACVGGGSFGEGKGVAALAGGGSFGEGKGVATCVGSGSFGEGKGVAAWAGGGSFGEGKGVATCVGGDVFLLAGVVTEACVGVGDTTVSVNRWFSGGKFCEEAQCCAGLGTLDCVSIEDEKSSSLNERCEVFLMTGARASLLFGGTSNAEAAPGFVPGATAVALEGDVAAGFAAVVGEDGVLAGWRCEGEGDGGCPALGSDSARWSSALKGCKQLPQRTRP